MNSQRGILMRKSFSGQIIHFLMLLVFDYCFHLLPFKCFITSEGYNMPACCFTLTRHLLYWHTEWWWWWWLELAREWGPVELLLSETSNEASWRVMSSSSGQGSFFSSYLCDGDDVPVGDVNTERFHRGAADVSHNPAAGHEIKPWLLSQEDWGSGSHVFTSWANLTKIISSLPALRSGFKVKGYVQHWDSCRGFAKFALVSSCPRSSHHVFGWGEELVTIWEADGIIFNLMVRIVCRKYLHSTLCCESFIYKTTPWHQLRDDDVNSTVAEQLVCKTEGPESTTGPDVSSDLSS